MLISKSANSIIAIGDEEGGIRLLDSSIDEDAGFTNAYLGFRPHVNSIMDLEFSSDDMLLATASGDQTSLVIDMTTQKPIYCLSNHFPSVKRVQFQPASNNKVFATCSRDGNVNIWDLRCKGFERPALQARCSLESESEPPPAPSALQKLLYPHVLNTIGGAHAYTTSHKPVQDNHCIPRKKVAKTRPNSGDCDNVSGLYSISNGHVLGPQKMANVKLGVVCNGIMKHGRFSQRATSSVQGIQGVQLTA